MSRHSFDPKIAAIVQVNAAVIYQNITFWVEKNQANGRNLRQGRYWTYNSVSAFADLFPYLTEKQIRTALKKLLDAGLLLKGHFSDDKYDRTSWYALGETISPEGQLDATNAAADRISSEGNVFAQKGKSLKNRCKPDSNPPLLKEIGEVDSEAEKVLAAYPADRLRGRATCLVQIQKASIEGILFSDLLQAVQTYASESSEFTRSKVCFSDNWFKARRWQGYLEAIRTKRENAQTAKVDHQARLACWISDRSPMCKHITASQVTALLASKLVTQAQIQAAGLRI